MVFEMCVLLLSHRVCQHKAITQLTDSSVADNGIVLCNPLWEHGLCRLHAPMFWLGYFCEQQKEFIASHRKVLLVFCTVAFAVLLPFWSGRLTIYAIPIQLVDWSTGSVNWTNLVITLYRMTIGMAGSMFFFLLAPWVYEKIEHWRITPVLNHVGKSTLGLYWTQTFLLECTLHGIGIYVNTINSAWLGPCITLLELVICYQAVLLFRKSRYTRLLF